MAGHDAKTVCAVIHNNESNAESDIVRTLTNAD